ncbi:MAG: tetratricopeptide repeat protein [candidate division WOR-3 bacterium]
MSVEDQIKEAITKQDFASAARLVVAHSRDLLQLGKINILKGFLNAIPEDEYAKNPKLLLVRANTDYLSGELLSAERKIQTAIPILKKQGDKSGLTAAYRYLSYIYQDMGENKKAIEVSKLGLRLLSPDDFRGRAGLLSTIAGSYWRLLKYKEAMQFYKKVMDIYIAIGDKEGEMRTLANASAIDVKLGNFQKARKEKEEVLRFYENSDNRRSYCLAALNLAGLYLLMRELDRAESLSTSAITEAMKIGLGLAIGPAMVNLGEILMFQKKFKQSEDTLLQAMKKTDDAQTSSFLTNCCIALSRLYRLQNKIDLSKKYALKALESCPADTPIEKAGAEFNMAQLYFATGKYTEGLKLLKKSLNYYKKMKMAYHTATGYLELTDGLLNQEKKASAVKTFSKALNICQKYGYDFLFDPAIFNNYWHLIEKLNPQSPRLYIKKLNLKYKPLTAIGSKLPEIKFLTFGGFEIFVNGVKIEKWRRNSARLVLSLLFTKQIINRGGELIFEDKFVPSDTLLLALWPEKPQALATMNLQVAINELRKRLEPNLKEGKKSQIIEYENHSYRMRLDSIHTDLEDFLKFYRQARQLEISGKNKEALKFYQKIFDLYKGDFLPGIDLTEVFAIREELNQIFVKSLLASARINLTEKNIETAVNQCKIALTKDPYSEECHRLLMECYARMNRKDLVLKQYKTIKNTLKDDLGLELSKETEDLKNRLLS